MKRGIAPLFTLSGCEMEKILRANKYLRVYNKNDITNRLLEATDGDMFLCYNNFKKSYELHSMRSFRKNRESLQASFQDGAHINQWLVRDVQANGTRRFLKEVEGEREYLQQLHEVKEEQTFNTMLDSNIKNVQAFLGRVF